MEESEARSQIDGFLAGYELEIRFLEEQLAIEPSPRIERTLDRNRRYLAEMRFWRSLLGNADASLEPSTEDASLN